tara:strand:+ start:219 stop:440 length:222 start_codon:yes stop_codon:yes gene_type:complete
VLVLVDQAELDLLVVNQHQIVLVKADQMVVMVDMVSVKLVVEIMVAVVVVGITLLARVRRELDILVMMVVLVQ